MGSEAKVALNGPRPDQPSLLVTLGTLLSMVWVFGTTIMFCVGLLVGLYFYPARVGLGFVLPYYTYTLTIGRHEVRDGWIWDWMRRTSPAMIFVRQFLKIRFVVAEELRKADGHSEAQFIFALFPHGVNADFRAPMDSRLYEAIPGTYKRVRTLAASVLFRIPILRELVLMTSAIDASRKVAEQCLKRKRSLLVLPGGQQEQLLTVFGRERIFISKRKGFVRLALKYNVPLVPVYVFGCSDYYYTSDLWIEWRLKLMKTTGIAIPFGVGYLGNLLCPFPVATTVVFGKPLVPNLKEGLSESEKVDEAHAQFIAALKELFDKHKGELGYGGRELEIM